MQRLAIVYPKAIGDFVFILPALHTLRQAFPDTRITLVVKAKQGPLAEPQKGRLFDELLVIAPGSGLLAIRRRLATAPADVIADMAGNDQSGLLLSFQKGRRLRPHPADCKGSCSIYSPLAESFPRLQPGLHRVHELLSYVRHLTDVEPVYSFQLSLPNAAVEEGEKIISKYQLRSGSVVALNIGASRSSKRWPAAHFMTLTKALLSYGHRVVLTGARLFRWDGNYDAGVASAFHKQGMFDGEKCINLIDEDVLPPALQLQRDTHFLRYSEAAQVVVGNDTGPMQIAGSVGDDARRKTVSLFGPTNWGRYAPFDPSRRYPDKPEGDWNRVLRSDLSCLPSRNIESCRSYRKGCPNQTCMKALSPEAVLKAVLAKLRGA